MKNRVAAAIRLLGQIALAATLAIAIGYGRALAEQAKDTPAKHVAKKRTGEELYAVHCSRCHVERYPTERTDAQWGTIMLHMRTRAASRRGLQGNPEVSAGEQLTVRRFPT